MEGLLKEISEIPERAFDCYQKNRGIKLPFGVPYLGMGASYYSPLTLFYCGKKINPGISSEYYYYLSDGIKPAGVLISQSGETSETIWASDKFRKVITITNNPCSSIGKLKKSEKNIQVCAGPEEFTSTKTYVNTLITLYLGLGTNPLKGINAIRSNFDDYKEQAKQQADKISKYIFSRRASGLYILGSGPNMGTAQEGALTLSETTKIAWTGLSVSQYDHGPKETAENSVLIVLNSGGRDKKRIDFLKKDLRNKSNALIVELSEDKLLENLSPLTLIVRLNLVMNYMADQMDIKEMFRVGRKITSVSKSIR